MNEIRQSAGKDLVWLAGFLEGDGSFVLNKQRMGKNRVIYTPAVKASNTDHSIIEEIAKIYNSLEIGHYVCSKKTKNGISKDITVKGFKRTRRLLPLLIPELRGKKKLQAQYLLDWINSRDITGNNKTYTDYEFELAAKIKELYKPDH